MGFNSGFKGLISAEAGRPIAECRAYRSPQGARFFYCHVERWHGSPVPWRNANLLKKKSVHTVLSTQLNSNTALCSNERRAETKEKEKKNVLQASFTFQITQRRTAKCEDIRRYFSVHTKHFNLTVTIHMMSKKGAIILAKSGLNLLPIAW